MPKPTLTPVIAHVPLALRRQIDAAAKRAKRSRSAEITVRLLESLRAASDMTPSNPRG